ncbi:MAG: Asp-tRNA(Asn)/Glu-tRNA(Gln) amidotransferase subunit GatB [Candidatus Gracilibacteria bacterium]|jgi:aspartyl-tRNA(Asn)/glutamyl-tRNA(Gln) amidotransferase subunit B
MREDFEVIIGLEIHAQIATKSKMFCGCSSYSFDQEPNINTCPVCMGFPGQLPVINREAFLKGVKAALALNCEIPGFSKFDRKNYFYPDLPKGYQISQFDQPVSKNGWLDIDVEGTKKKICITRLHLEDDAGKLTHVDGGTLCDYNRSGIALMEIVSEPDIRTSQEAVAYAKSIQAILRFVGSSEADMEKGMMRFDASVSIRKHGDKKLNPRAEIKNLNSFNSLKAAIEYEIERQIFLWEEGNPLNSDITVGWTDDKQKTYFLRDKEGASDYRYFPEPDLPPIEVTADFIDKLKAELPELPNQKRDRYLSDWKLSAAEALLISSDVSFAKYFEEVVAACNDPRKAASFFTSILFGRLNKDGLTLAENKVSAQNLGKIIQLVNDSQISMNMAKNDVFESVYVDGKDPEVVVKEKGLAQMSDVSALNDVCKKTIDANPKSVEDFKKGKAAAMQFLVGQVMKQTKGQANAQAVQEIMSGLLA